MTKRILVFLLINFAALAIGSLFTDTGVSSDWYQNLNQAPWTPPGWVFGAAWTTIMIFFAIYMAYLIRAQNTKRIIFLFSLQWLLNVGWNPIFFYSQAITFGLICILLLTLLIAYFFFYFRKTLHLKTLLLAPYLIWLIIASSLNAYIYLYN